MINSKDRFPPFHRYHYHFSLYKNRYREDKKKTLTCRLFCHSFNLCISVLSIFSRSSTFVGQRLFYILNTIDKSFYVTKTTKKNQSQSIVNRQIDCRSTPLTVFRFQTVQFNLVRFVLSLLLQTTCTRCQLIFLFPRFRPHIERQLADRRHIVYSST